MTDQRALDRLLGSWDVTMRHTAVPEPVAGTQRFERVLDGAFVMLHWTFEHPDFPNAVALLSEDVCHYFDVRGVIRVFDSKIDDAGWSMVWLDPEFSQRLSTRFLGPDEMESTGDASHDLGATWELDFTMSYRRV